MELGALVNSLARSAAPLQRDGERVALGLKLVLGVLREHGARPDLLRELQSLVGRNDRVTLIQPAGGGARLEAGGKHFPLPDPLRQALLAARPQAVTTPGPAAAVAASMMATPGATASAAVHPDVLLRSMLAALPLAAQAGAAQAARRPRRVAEPVRAMTLQLPEALLDDALDTGLAGTRLQAALRSSPLAAEAQGLRAALGGRDADTSAAAPPSSAERVAMQLDSARREVLAFDLAVWDRQQARLEIAAERSEADDAGGSVCAASVFTATLRLDLPRLGAVAVTLRLLNGALAATVAALNPEPLRGALPLLAQQLRDRGLQPAALVAVALEDESGS